MTEWRPVSAGATPMVPANGLSGTFPNGGEGRHDGFVPVVGPDMQRRVLELIGQKSEARDIRGPAEAGGLVLQDLHHQCITGFGPVHMDRAGDRIDLARIHGGQVVCGAVRSQLTGGTVHAFEIPAPHPGPPFRPGQWNYPSRSDAVPHGSCSSRFCNSRTSFAQTVSSLTGHRPMGLVRYFTACSDRL